MSRTRSTALEQLVNNINRGRFYGISTLALGPGTVHTFFSLMSLDDTLKQQSNT